MIRVSVLYPNSEGLRFDMDYYMSSHIPMVGDLLGSALKSISVDAGIGGGEAGSAAPFAAMAHLTFDSVEAFQGAFGPHAEKIMGDIPNYTDAAPVVQVSDAKS